MKLRNTLVALAVGVLTLLPVGASAGQCPDPDNPCDIQPIDIKQEICYRIKWC